MGLTIGQKIEQAEDALKGTLQAMTFDIFDAVHLVLVNGEWQIHLSSTGDPSQTFKYGEGETIVEAIKETQDHINAEKRCYKCDSN